jgi:hypothetical protein
VLVIMCTIMCWLVKSGKPRRLESIWGLFSSLEVDTNVVVVFAYIYVLICLHAVYFLMVDSLGYCD